MMRVSFGLIALVGLLASSSTVYAGSITSLVGGTLFQSDEARLKFALLNGGAAAESGHALSSIPELPSASPLLEGDVIFTMIVAGGAPGSNMGFQYGAEGIDPKLPGGMSAPAAIPEPATLLLLATGVGLALRRRKQRHVEPDAGLS